jgi:F0F1-type ATP synthase delta subunit
MQVVQCYKTSDGVLHSDFDKAVSHANERYGNALLHLAKEVLSIDKYEAMTEFLENDANIQKFLELQKLKNDIKKTSEDPWDE